MPIIENPIRLDMFQEIVGINLPTDEEIGDTYSRYIFIIDSNNANQFRSTSPTDGSLIAPPGSEAPVYYTGRKFDPGSHGSGWPSSQTVSVGNWSYVFGSIFNGAQPQGGATVQPQSGAFINEAGLAVDYWKSGLSVVIDWHAAQFTGTPQNYNNTYGSVLGLKSAIYNPAAVLVSTLTFDFSGASITNIEGVVFNAYGMRYIASDTALSNHQFELLYKRAGA